MIMKSTTSRANNGGERMRVSTCLMFCFWTFILGIVVGMFVIDLQKEPTKEISVVDIDSRIHSELLECQVAYELMREANHINRNSLLHFRKKADMCNPSVDKVPGWSHTL